jgi:hypothetical protein
MKKMKVIIACLIIPIIFILSCSKEEFENNKYNPATSWSSDFDYDDLLDYIESQRLDGDYDKLVPVGEKWTYGTIQPDNSLIELINNDYIKCYTESQIGLTSKAQLVRKFPPYGILKGYDGITAFNSTDVIIVTLDLYLKSGYLNDGKVYFLDFEDSMSGSAGIRFFIHNNTAIGVNIDKIKPDDNTFYAETTIPTDEWFSFKLELLVEEQGSYKIWINGSLVFQIQEQSFDDDLHFYDAVMTGITGSIKESPSELWIDNFNIEVIRGDY